jgi:O-6-methylguanine DNA methyltransferase
MILVRALIDTPVGVMRALANDTALFAFEFYREERMARLDARLSRWLPEATIADGSNEVIAQTREWARRYFAGESADISALPLDMRGAPFEQQVWGALRGIPPGTTTSYGAIARALGNPTASRAVGMANGANPIAIIVPCHRVIGANGTLTGYGGGLDRKTWLLDHERTHWGRESASRLPFD